MPILGVVASSTSASNLVGDYESIATVTGNGSSDTVSFTSIPATFKHLQIRFIGRVTPATGQENVALYFNSDTGGNYQTIYIYGNRTSASTGIGSNTYGIRTMGRVPGASIASNVMGTSVIDIIDYANTDKPKVAKTISGWTANGSGEAWIGAGTWRDNLAITRIDIVQLYGSGGWTTSSTFALYGIR
jgi:hypothetical protein